MDSTEKTDVEVIDEEVIIPDETIKGIVSQVSDSVKSALAEQEKTIDEKIEKALASHTANVSTDTPVVKGFKAGDADTAKTFGTTRNIEAFEGARKEVRHIRQARAQLSGDRNTMKHMNDFNLGRIAEYEADLDQLSAEKNITGRYLSKASYANETTDSEGGYLIPDPEFLIGIERYENQFGVAFANCTVHTTDRTTVKANTGINNVEMYELGEAEAKTQTKPSFGQVEATLRKFASIIVAGDEFLDDEAAGFWQDTTLGLARDRAKKADQIVFTEDQADPTKRGILNTPGVTTETVGSAITSLTWDDLLNAEAAVLPEGKLNAKYVMHRSVWNTLIKTKGTANDHYYWLPSMQKSTPWGTPVIESELFRSSTAGENNQPYAVYGDLSKLKLVVKGGLTLTYGTEGTVGSLNLYEQDLTALRAVTRMTKLITFPERFVVLGTGTVS